MGNDEVKCRVQAAVLLLEDCPWDKEQQAPGELHLEKHLGATSKKGELEAMERGRTLLPLSSESRWDEREN